MSFGRLSRSARTRTRRRALLALSVPVILSLTLAACGGDDEPESTDGGDPTDPTDTAGAVSFNASWPLTGETLSGDAPDHPVYVVKIDNTSSSAPQVGLGSADMIVEELVEGGLTRLAVFFYSDIPDDVGPVRSMRASDIGITKPVAANLVASGAARPTIARLDTANVPSFVEGATGFYRSSDRLAPYNLFMNLTDLANKPGKTWDPPAEPYLTFADPSEFNGTIKVGTIEASFSGAHTTDWTYTAKGWTRPDTYAESGDDFIADNVLLLRVKTKDAGYVDGAGNPVPETIFTGKGEGVLVHGNKAVKVTWSKDNESSTLVLTNKQGEDVPVPVGHTWIELVPTSTGSVTLSR